MSPDNRRTEIAIERELARCEKLQGHLDERDSDALYGAVQALAWVLTQDAAAPHVLVSPLSESDA